MCKINVECVVWQSKCTMKTLRCNPGGTVRTLTHKYTHTYTHNWQSQWIIGGTRRGIQGGCRKNIHTYISHIVCDNSLYLVYTTFSRRHFPCNNWFCMFRTLCDNNAPYFFNNHKLTDSDCFNENIIIFRENCPVHCIQQMEFDCIRMSVVY